METPEQKELEQFIHQQLKKLPERDAPEDLMSNVFAAIKERETAPWWKHSFSYWPRNTQALLLGALSVIFAAIVYAAWTPAGAINANALVERASAFAWLGRLVDALASGALLAFRNLSWEWLVAFAVVLAAMYGACVATGFALYRITARHITSAAQS